MDGSRCQHVARQLLKVHLKVDLTQVLLGVPPQVALEEPQELQEPQEFPFQTYLNSRGIHHIDNDFPSQEPRLQEYHLEHLFLYGPAHPSRAYVRREVNPQTHEVESKWVWK